MNPVNLEISWVALWRVVIVAGFAFLIYSVRETMTVLLLAIFISAALDNWVVRLEKFVPRLFAAIIIFILFISILALVLYTVVPVAILELKGLLNNLGGLSSQLFGEDSHIELNKFIDPNLDKLTNLLLSGNPASFFGVVGKVLGGVTFFIATLITSFYLTASRDGVGNFLRAVFPENLENKVLQIYYRVKTKIGRWFQAQILLALVIGIITFIGLWFTSINYPFLLAVIAALFEVVPVVGPIFAGGIAVMVALTESVDLALYVLILYLVIQQVESHVLVPIIMKKAIGVHPVIILISLLAGFEIAGPVGVILSVPAAVIAGEIAEDWATQKRSRREKPQV
ncbi:MAG: AI-2E family transporter [Candidatus Colwellbacteria bacterium]|nr:AI-2E family transporter [Candidatus Colwellbacteria bacterium]